MSSQGLTQNRTYDVYAEPFVPEFLLAINRAHAPHVYPLRSPSFEIDFVKYIRSFSGADFLRPVPHDSESFSSYTVSHNRILGNLTTTNYKNYFASWLRTETSALQLSQTQHDLFKVPLHFSQSQDQPDTVVLTSSLTVPGLAEDSPLIFIGDVVHLRPLVFDSKGEALKYAQGYKHGAFVNSRLYLPGWNGDLFHAEVTVVKRATETINIRMSLIPEIAHTLSQRLPAHFNVHFPPRAASERALWRAIRTASAHLDSRANTYASVTTNGVHGDVGPGWLQKMIFPEESYGRQQTKLNSIHFSFEPIDRQLNHEQLRAVDSVVKNTYGTVPFIIHGPPGTGKTKTLVETVLQLLRTESAKHVLVCAPSDPAADTLAERLKNSLSPNELLRLNSPSRTFAEVADGLLPFCYVDSDHFGIPPFKSMIKYKVVVTTCRDADLLTQAQLTNKALYDFKVEMFSVLQEDGQLIPTPPWHWQAVVIDEAAQATEPEALIPLTVVAIPAMASTTHKDPIFVMAGDQQQLGPRTASQDPNVRRSLFDRLLSRALYSEHPLARHRLGSGILAARPLTKDMLPIIRPPFSNLLRNYRSHPAILAVPNALFYHETLLPEASHTDSLEGWVGWQLRWPVLFSQNTGPDEIETDGGGWFNIAEIDRAYEHTISLLQSGLIDPQDICVMSPFSAQVRRLRIKFREMGLHRVNIGPMDAFQGLESRVVILCTTRSRERFLDQDKNRGFGIIHEPKRLNVAITRAKHGLIVIGNHQVLSTDLCWRAFLDFCIRNNLVDGQLNSQVISMAQGAPVPILENMLKRKAVQVEPVLLGVTGELDDAMWIQGAIDGVPQIDDEEEDEGDSDEDVGDEPDYSSERSAENDM